MSKITLKLAYPTSRPCKRIAKSKGSLKKSLCEGSEERDEESSGRRIDMVLFGSVDKEKQSWKFIDQTFLLFKLRYTNFMAA